MVFEEDLRKGTAEQGSSCILKKKNTTLAQQPVINLVLPYT